MNTRYNANHPSFEGYSLIHGDYIDLRLWKPQSEFWKHHIREYKARTGCDIFPARLFSEMHRGDFSCVNLPTGPELRAETILNLSYVFINDAMWRENEALDYPGLNAAYHRAKIQMQKYLNKLLEKIRKEKSDD